MLVQPTLLPGGARDKETTPGGRRQHNTTLPPLPPNQQPDPWQMPDAPDAKRRAPRARPKPGEVRMPNVTPRHGMRARSASAECQRMRCRETTKQQNNKQQQAGSRGGQTTTKGSRNIWIGHELWLLSPRAGRGLAFVGSGVGVFSLPTVNTLASSGGCVYTRAYMRSLGGWQTNRLEHEEQDESVGMNKTCFSVGASNKYLWRITRV
ncbi:uncharacterized protein B0H64DRAFT_225264 [Chaetomium fimeti]|uniref:Uncharacterized protein n=1 Tax=Chaetomium fimeti TaxID=1854472 RepID=A0AAE0H9P1_9PEZI|nr:hypothetical protein B0H64DRAFT_225264 [Chaetomium fimeti]